MLYKNTSLSPVGWLVQLIVIQLMYWFTLTVDRSSQIGSTNTQCRLWLPISINQCMTTWPTPIFGYQPWHVWSILASHGHGTHGTRAAHRVKPQKMAATDHTRANVVGCVEEQPQIVSYVVSFMYQYGYTSENTMMWASKPPGEWTWFFKSCNDT